MFGIVESSESALVTYPVVNAQPCLEVSGDQSASVVVLSLDWYKALVDLDRRIEEGQILPL
jgi:hypothetical protein